MRGRKPKPTVLKDLHRSTEPRNADEPRPVGHLSAPPEHFDTEQQALWDYALEHSPPGMLTLIDFGALEVWTVALAMHRKATRVLSKQGMVIAAPNTRVPIQNPYLSIMNRQALIMLRASEQLGFTPAARPRITSGTGMPVGGESLNGSRLDASDTESIDDYLLSAPKARAIH
jgi:P27 family predicted phage terminase small subunit